MNGDTDRVRVDGIATISYERQGDPGEDYADAVEDGTDAIVNALDRVGWALVGDGREAIPGGLRERMRFVRTTNGAQEVLTLSRTTAALAPAAAAPRLDA